MTESKPTLNDWLGLYQAAMRVKEVAPWEWMTETDVFGVQEPETGELGFVSIMGMLFCGLIPPFDRDGLAAV
jgi:hypothetical protein